MLKGIGVSSGIAIGTVAKFLQKPLTYNDRFVTDTVAEKERFLKAVDEFCRRTNRLALMMDETAADGQILRGYAVMINDPYLTEYVTELIDKGTCAEKAIEKACDGFIKLFTDSADELVRHRAADIEDIKFQMLEILLDAKQPKLGDLLEGAILVTRELTPSMTVGIGESGVVGIVAEKGGRTSHAAIIARSLGIPTVLGMGTAIEKISNNEKIAINGDTGEIYTCFEDGFERLCEQQKTFSLKNYEQFANFVGKPTLTSDKKQIKLFANIDSPRDIESVLKNDAEGIGLFRTEGFFLDRGILPSEGEQTKAYRAVAEAMNGKEVVIRTLDVGGDKKLPTLESENEDNPFLGLRAIRHSIKNQGLFRTQLRAILRASAFGNISLMIPLVTRVDEVLYVKSLLERLKAELDTEGIEYKKDIKIGVMIETPAACAIADVLAEQVDFFSIGTNDLIGYTMAVDRGNAQVSYLYSVYEPAVLRMIKHIVDVARQYSIRCCMCGEAAADEKLLPLLLAFGLEELSVEPSNVLGLRAKVSSLDMAWCKEKENEAVKKSRAREIEQFLSDI